MQEDNHQISNDNKETDDDTFEMHTCACGEQHRHMPGSPSHRDECISPKKFSDSCCCRADDVQKGNQHRCGHGPRCR